MIKCIRHSLFTAACRRSFSTVMASESTPLFRQLRARILTSGPITVADYMREVLTNPYAGYYMNKDVFGKEGDFVTSPEISQLFGEMTAVWLLSEWQKVGSPKPLQLVELGPGRGTLMEDILRVFKKLKAPLDSISVHFVEVSPKLSELQEKRLCGTETTSASEDACYKTSQTKDGSQVSWYRHLSDIPEGFTFFIAHEFFDALPVHKFTKTDQGWREILIDVESPDEANNKLRFVIARSETPATKIYHKFCPTSLDAAEVSPDSILIARQIAKRIHEDGGCALITDYGHHGTKGDSFRAFRNHKLHEPLEDPGTADLTADVDFSTIRKAVTEGLETPVMAYGPITQSRFLSSLGIEQRLQKLLLNATPDQSKDLISGYRMLTEREQMGERFKLMALFPLVLKEHLARFPPTGFTCE